MKRDKPRMISVVIPNFNGGALLEEQLRALAKQTYEGTWEVIVADNGSTDGSPGAARAWSDRMPILRVIDASARSGASFARDEGAAQAHGDFIAYCDADDLATPDWVRAMAEAAASSDLVGGPLEKKTLNESSVRASHAPPPLDQLHTAHGFLPFTPASNLGIWKRVLEEIGGWADGYPGASSEDTDLCWRAQLAGYKLSFAPEAVMLYRYRTGTRALARQRYMYGQADVLLYRNFVPFGLPRPHVLKMARAWLALVFRIPFLLRSKTHREIWARLAAYRMGRAVGSFRYRAMFL